MNKVGFLLTAKCKQIRVRVYDIFGKDYEINYVGYINNSYSIDGTYTIREPYFDVIKEDAFKYGAWINPNLCVKIGKIELIKESISEISRSVYLTYLFFKPTIKVSSDITIKEMQ